MLSKQLVMEKISAISELSESISGNNGEKSSWWYIREEADMQDVNGEQRVYSD